ncbi:MAG: hypothetical protein DWQ34_02635 [Planctomycetota bacterium]|nr:MAG: hypothetical protein DWQ29_08350 [Planctomycetota bacterium]REJ97239.1 MAG: hypothetical protein DWQ34_02635 [Planctomycetota bacterium]REK30311.1 MAG: hypothetical protein DWQ41_02125 [Planctomycetota bacterium]REK31538.1 MAG: hypothetical protein DWQ45_19635 [Planctomycetota bacterium]
MNSNDVSRQATTALARNLLDSLDALIAHARDEDKPLEVDPFRGELFELFVTAEAAGLVQEEADPDLTADGLCRSLAERWGLRAAAQESVESEAKFSSEHVDEMRLLWSVMRMWMEWTYAWQRWPEFHRTEKTS